MKYYAEFYCTYSDGKTSKLCGTDGTIRMDGRLSQANMIRAAHIHAWRYRFVHKHMSHFMICAYSDSRPYGDPVKQTRLIAIDEKAGLL